MFDTLEIPLPPDSWFSKPVAAVIDAMRAPVPEVPFKRNRLYTAVVDLRDVAHITGVEQDAILHLQSHNTGSHKIQIVEAGQKCKGQIYDVVSGIVDRTHPELLSLSRVDACANFVDGPDVQWFAQSVRAKCAQWQAQIGTVELHDTTGKRMQFAEMGKRELGTIYMGKKPNCYRVYDKKAERFAAYERERRRHERGWRKLLAEACADPLPWSKPVEAMFSKLDNTMLRDAGRRMHPFPSFESWFAEQCLGGMSGIGQQMTLEPQPEQQRLWTLPDVLTRVERQMGGGRVPEQLNTFEKLFRNALDFNPFARMEFLSGDAAVEATDFSFMEHMAGLMMRQLVYGNKVYNIPPEFSDQQLFAMANLWPSRKSGKPSGSAARMWEKFAPYLAPPKNRAAVTSAELFDNYRDTISRQLAA